MKTRDTDVVIIGGGIAGLTCAGLLKDHKVNSLVLEADDSIGGRIRTDYKEGFLLDRGFQVLQTAYPAAREILDYQQLDLQNFAPGTIIRINKRFHTIADPLRRPSDLIGTMTAPIGTFGDRLRLIKLAKQVTSSRFEELFKGVETDTMSFLRQQGFSDDIINRFFKPFFGGTCLDRDIGASSRVFKYILRMFATGDAAVPRKGMQQIPLQLAEKLDPGTIQLNQKVREIIPGEVTLETGQKIQAKAVVIATNGPQAEHLLGREPATGSIGEKCLYFGADKADWHSSYLVLNGNNDGLINNIAMPSMASPDYAPEGKTLIGVVVLAPYPEDQSSMEDKVLAQLRDWYGSEVLNWKHLETYSIDHALPDQKHPTPVPLDTDPVVGEGIFACGELGSLPAIQWSLYSGRKTAEAVAEYLKAKE